MAKKLYFILARDDGIQVFTDKNKMLPVFPKTMPNNIGFANPHPYNEWFEENFGVAVFRRFVIELPFLPFSLFVMEQVDKKDSQKGYWLCSKEVGQNYKGELQAFLEKLPQLYSKSKLMPWVKRGYDVYREWLLNEVEVLGYKIKGSIKQVKNAYTSSVFCCQTQKGKLYMKMVGDVFLREIAISKKLEEWEIIELPYCVAVDQGKNVYITEDMKGKDMTPGADMETLRAAVRDYACLQISAIPYLQGFDTYPFYDLRLSVLQRAASELVHNGPALLEKSPYELQEKEKEELQESLGYLAGKCQELNDLKFPFSIDHGDLRPGNIRITERGYIFYDWAWSTVTHPFFSLAGFLHIMRRAIKENELIVLRDEYLYQWQELGSSGDLKNMFGLVEKLQNLYNAVLDSIWLENIMEVLDGQSADRIFPDAWALERRQYYFAKVLRRLIL